MRRWYDKSMKQWAWICTKSNNGVKCKSGKFSIRKGTMFSNTNFSIQQQLWMVWHFVHGLSQAQCRSYMSIGQHNLEAVSRWYGVCRDICDQWIRQNMPKLGGYGNVCEFDESYFAGAAKYGKGRERGWKDYWEWVFGIAERGRLDCWMQQVPANRNRAQLLPILAQRCKEGTTFWSDGWGAYNKLQEHLELDDIEHFVVNHKRHYVDPITGAHTQLIEGTWKQCKDTLPNGIDPKD